MFSSIPHDPPLKQWHTYSCSESTQTVEEIRQLWGEEYEENFLGEKIGKRELITPSSIYIQQLLAPRLPLKKLNTEDGNVIINALPDEKLEQVPTYNLIESLNKTNLERLPERFFLKHRYGARVVFDTAPSEEGLKCLMFYFTQSTGLQGNVFLDADSFIDAIPQLKEQLHTPMACLVCCESTKRHMTGIYLTQEGAYIFDTTGISLPAYPCGHRSYSENTLLEKVVDELLDNGMKPAIMPVNTVVSIQNDKYSCLMAVILFFIGMQLGGYQLLDTPGITDSYGDSYFRTFVNVPLLAYTTTFLPLLVGCQSRLPFLFMMDPIRDIDSKFLEIVRYRTDWQRQNYNDNNSYNIFWQVAYVELLAWLNRCNLDQKAYPLPDFLDLAKKGFQQDFSNRPKSKFEEKVEEIQTEIMRVPLKPKVLDNQGMFFSINPENDESEIDVSTVETVEAVDVNLLKYVKSLLTNQLPEPLVEPKAPHNQGLMSPLTSSNLTNNVQNNDKKTDTVLLKKDDSLTKSSENNQIVGIEKNEGIDENQGIFPQTKSVVKPEVFINQDGFGSINPENDEEDNLIDYSYCSIL